MKKISKYAILVLLAVSVVFNLFQQKHNASLSDEHRDIIALADSLSQEVDSLSNQCEMLDIKRNRWRRYYIGESGQLYCALKFCLPEEIREDVTAIRNDIQLFCDSINEGYELTTKKVHFY